MLTGDNMMGELIDKLEGVAFAGVKELAETAKRILSESSGEWPWTKRVSDISERTVRWYITEGLLPEPDKKVGTSSIYSYHHLLTLLVVKRLQAEKIPISTIREVLKGRSEQEMESLLVEPIHSKVVSDPKERWRYSSMTSQELEHEFGEKVQRVTNPEEITEYMASSEPPPVTAPLKSPAHSFLESIRFSRPVPERNIEDQATSPVLKSVAGPQCPRTWLRHVIEPGLELHVSEDFDPPRDHKARERIVDRMRQILGLR
jgi:DNA-binding transcriptional MerR regulator